MDGLQDIAFHIAIEAFVNKNTSIRNTDKEQAFFERQVEEIDAEDVIGIEAPHPFGRLEYIPRNKDEHHHKNRWKQGFPSFVKGHPFVEAQCQRTQQRKQIECQV